MDALINDVRHAVRGLIKNRGFASVAILTLALGIGANTAIFSVVNAVLLRPLPYRDPATLAMVWERNIPRHRDRNVANPANYAAWRERNHNFSDLAWISWTSLVFTGEAPERVQGLSVSPNFFRTLGTAPRIGRGFTDDEGRVSSRVVMLSDALWRRRFGADPAIVGRSVPVPGGTVQVAGVMPRDFRPLFSEEYWQPFPLDTNTRQFSGRYGVALGRLKPGRSMDQAQAEMSTIATRLAAEQPQFDAGWNVTVVPLTEQVVGGSRRTLLLLLGAVALVLLIACANVGGLLVARSAAREREVAVRDALGASPWRQLRGRLVEGLVLAMAGAAAGVLLAVWGVAGLKAVAPQGSIPRLDEVTLDGRVLLVTILVAGAAGIAFGLPSGLGRRGSAAGALHGSRSIGLLSATRVRSALVCAQLALAVVLLAGAGLLMRSVWQLQAVNPGFDPTDVLTVSVQLPSTYGSDTAQNLFFDRLLARARALPGVTDAGLVSWVPLSGIGAATSFTVVGAPPPAPGLSPTADIRLVDAGYFTTLRIPLLRGRLVGPEDRGGPLVVLVNQTLARQMFPGQEALGQRLKISWWHPDATPEIVGVVGDVQHVGLDADPRPTIYYPRAQETGSGFSLVLRTKEPAATIARDAGAIVHELDAAVPLGTTQPLSDVVRASFDDRRYPMALLQLFAALAVALAGVGVYGVLASVVGQRTREFGVRMALGAAPGDVLKSVLGRGLRLAATGVAIGAVAALAGTRALTRLLYHTAPSDPLTLLSVGVFLVGVALVAAYIPARRATRVDPLVALRHE